MSSSVSIEQTSLELEVIHEVESFFSEEPPIEEWSSLNAEIPEENVKRLLYEQDLYSPGSGEICAKYVPLSVSSVFRHPYYNYPSVPDPGIKEALLNPAPKIIPKSDDGQELYLDLCKEMCVCPIRCFYRNLLDREIDLRYYGIHPLGFRAIAMALNNNRLVKVLDLTDNWISEDGCYHLGEMFVRNISLEELNLHGCRIGPEGARRLLANIHVNRTLRKINLTKNCLTDAGVEYLSKAIFLGFDIANINLSHNSLTAKSLVTLTSAFETHNKLTHLNLSWNTIFSPNAIFNLCNMLSTNTKLEEINLSWNSLTGPRIGSAIKQLMKAPNLRSLYLNNNRLSDEVTQIAGSLSTSKVTTLDLSYNPLTPDNALFLLSKLKIRKVKLQNLFLENVLVTAEFIELKDKILAMKSRKNAVIKWGEVIPKFVSANGDMREIVLRRAEFLCNKGKKSSVDIALVFLEICKYEKPLEIKEFSRVLKTLGATSLDADLIEEIVNSFPGPSKKKEKTIHLVMLADYVHRKWPDKKLPPSPPPEVIVPDVKDSKKKKKKK
ncbi:leucine-rich repeat-containing protein 74B-like [Maniola hyperantus]|uniref:leucine-rich repeat-containing protein 74B-like n=1 Tax=Aphantopus hyperantus TaxID=2795564 RepID=UPI001569AF29|nr:leucine-rich repeat-containing protein 74B-like [Maniola hyperantus]